MICKSFFFEILEEGLFMKSKKILLITFFLASFLFGSKAVYAGQSCSYHIDSSEIESASIRGLGDFVYCQVGDDSKASCTTNNNASKMFEKNYSYSFRQSYIEITNCPPKIYQCFQGQSNICQLYVDKPSASRNPFCFEYNLDTKYDPTLPDSKPDNNCEGLFSDKLLKKLSEYFNILKIVVPIIVIVLSSLDFAKSVLNSDSDDFKKSQIKFAKRLVLSVVFFLLPIILNFILQAVNSSMSTCGIG